MGKVLPKEKQFGVKVCRERKCEDLQRDPQYPESPQYCAVTHGMPGSMPCCVKEMDDEHFIRQISGQLNSSHYNAPRPGPKNCPAACPYKISEPGEVFGKTGESKWKKKPGTIWKCAFTGGVLGQGLGGSCLCHVLDNPEQEKHIKLLTTIIKVHRNIPPDELLGNCRLSPCPDGVQRCKGGTDCPVIKLPFAEMKECPLWRIPAKLLQAPPAEPAIETPPKPTTEPKQNIEKKPPSEKKTRKKKKESEDPICEACRQRFGKPVPDYACEGCKEEQEKRGRRAWTTGLSLQVVHLGDMETLGKEIPDESVDMIFTDPPYIKELYEMAYAGLATLAARVLKPHGFLITYAPQTHLDEIMDILRYTHESTTQKRILQYFWIISSLNEGRSTAKNHQRNAICLHKPILIFQKADDGTPLKGSHRCFADVVRGKKQKAFHPWQQSIHDVLGIISRFMVPGEILLDPFAGTGTSLKAANLLGMDWIGFEIDPKTHAIAVRELQQQPLGLQAFGIEAEAPECEREPETVQKDTSKQASIEICKVVKTRKPPDTTAKTPREVFDEGHGNNASLKGFKRDTPEWFAALTESKRGSCPGWYWEVWKISPVKNAEWLYEGGRTEKEAKEIRKRLENDESQKGCTFEVRKQPEPDARPVEVVSACLDCQALDKCKSHDPHAGCMNELAETVAPGYPTSIGGPICKTCGWPETQEPEPYIQHCCGTCGHHKGRKTFHETCPRLGELLFKGGTRSAKVLMEETQRENCEGWISKAERIPNVTWCSTIRNCPSLDWEGGICTKTGKKLTDQTYCPTQHQVGEKPEAPKKPASRKPKKTTTEPAGKPAISSNEECVGCRFDNLGANHISGPGCLHPDFGKSDFCYRPARGEGGCYESKQESETS